MNVVSFISIMSKEKTKIIVKWSLTFKYWKKKKWEEKRITLIKEKGKGRGWQKEGKQKYELLKILNLKRRGNVKQNKRKERKLMERKEREREREQIREITTPKDEQMHNYTTFLTTSLAFLPSLHLFPASLPSILSSIHPFFPPLHPFLLPSLSSPPFKLRVSGVPQGETQESKH